MSIRHGQVTVKVYPWRHPSGRDYWRFDWRDAQGKRRQTTKASLAEAKRLALDRAKVILSGTVKLQDLPKDVLARLIRVLAVDPTLERAVRAVEASGGYSSTVTLSEAVQAFLSAKKATAGPSPLNVKSLRKAVNSLVEMHGDKRLHEITVEDIDRWLHSNDGHAARTISNRRNAAKTLFRWCRKKGWLPEGDTAVDKTERPIITRSSPHTYTPEQLVVLFRNVLPRYLPWLALAAFAGIRADELYARGGKSSLMWEDFAWDRDVIVVRPDTAKTKSRRVVPILPVLRDWLWEIRKDDGPVCSGKNPQDRAGREEMSETTRLGKLIGGWKRNALRHSFITYRAALVGIAQAAMEAGNSESESRRSYLDAAGRDIAESWFKTDRRKCRTAENKALES